MKKHYTTAPPMPQAGTTNGCAFQATGLLFFAAAALWTVGYFAYHLITKA